MTTDKNRFVAEKLGLCWHGIVAYAGYNPAFNSDAGAVQLLRLMEEHKDYKEFISSLVESTYVYRGVLKVHHSIFIKDYITTPGKLLDAVWEWVRKEAHVTSASAAS